MLASLKSCELLLGIGKGSRLAPGQCSTCDLVVRGHCLQMARNQLNWYTPSSGISSHDSQTFHYSAAPTSAHSRSAVSCQVYGVPYPRLRTRPDHSNTRPSQHCNKRPSGNAGGMQPICVHVHTHHKATHEASWLVAQLNRCGPQCVNSYWTD